MYNKAIPRMFNLQEKYAINNSKKPFHPVFVIRSLLLRKLFFTFTLQQIYNLQNITDLKPANLRIFEHQEASETVPNAFQTVFTAFSK